MEVVLTAAVEAEAFSYQDQRINDDILEQCTLTKFLGGAGGDLM